MSREVRTVRPFKISRSFDQLFSKAKLHFGDRTCEPDARITVDKPELHTYKKAELHWTSEDSFESFKNALANGVAEQDIDRSVLALLVTVTTPYLKITNAIRQVSLSDLDAVDRVVVLTEPDPPLALRTPYHGATVDGCLLLTRTIARRPLSPWRRGTWLARVQFTIATEQAQRLFHPKPLDEQKRKELGLSSKTMRYVRMGDHDPLGSYDDSEPPELYVDRELLDELSTGGRSSWSEAMQLQIAHDFMTAVVVTAAQRQDELRDKTLRDLSDSLLGRVLDIAAKSDASREKLLRDVCAEPARVIADIDAALNMLEPARKAVRGSEEP